jgi:tRNA1(Val) A37 N6-methylase TrmN6
MKANNSQIKNMTTHYKFSVATNLAAYKSMVDTILLRLFPPSIPPRRVE